MSKFIMSNLFNMPCAMKCFMLSKTWLVYSKPNQIRASSQYKDHPYLETPIIKMKQSWGDLIFIMGISIMVRWNLYIEAIPRACFSIYPWISSYPMREDVIYVLSFLIDWNLAQPYKENFVGRSNKNYLLSLMQQIHTAVWAYLIQNVKCYKYIFIANMLLRWILRSYNT